MDKAREIIALPKLTERGIEGQIMDAAWPQYGGNHQTAKFWNDFGEGVEFTFKALTAAGWRLVPPGGVDGETVERCADAAYRHPDYISTLTPDEEGMFQPGSPYDRGRYDARKAIRSLKGEG